MGLVTVFGRVGDHSHVAIPGRGARLWFKPPRAQVVDGVVLSSVEVPATLNDATGEFTAELDNRSSYIPVLDWLVNDSDEPPEQRARGMEEWAEIYPGDGGEITGLSSSALFGPTLLFGNGAPPAWTPPGGVYWDLLSPVGVDIYSEGGLIS